MNTMHISKLDLNLIYVADAIYRHSNLTAAAKDLHLSQSAVSHALTRLRRHFDDPLFVRISKGVRPTPFALKLRPQIESMIATSHSLNTAQNSFDPASAKGRITIATTDYAEIVLFSQLLPELTLEAPNIQISLRPTLGKLPTSEIENGDYDIAIAGFYQKLPDGFYRTSLFRDTFATAIGTSFWPENKKLTDRAFFELKHAMITLQGDWTDSLIKNSSGIKNRRDLKFGTYSFGGCAWSISQSPIALTAPAKLLEQYRRFFPIGIHKCPIPTRTLEMQMVWHGLTHQNPLHKWIRERIKTFAANI